MIRHPVWSAIALLSLACLGACGPTLTPSPDATVVASPVPLTELPTEPPVTAPPAEPPATAVTTSAPEGQGNADVLYVRAVQASDGTWTFHVTVAHPDTGWEDYADGWDVLTPDGTVLNPDPGSPFTRLLLHPHESEQPFTRSQSGIAIPPGVSQVRVRAHDLVDGYGGREVWVDLTVESGEDFEVEASP